MQLVSSSETFRHAVGEFISSFEIFSQLVSQLIISFETFRHLVDEFTSSFKAVRQLVHAVVCCH